MYKHIYIYIIKNIYIYIHMQNYIYIYIFVYRHSLPAQGYIVGYPKFTMVACYQPTLICVFNQGKLSHHYHTLRFNQLK